VLKRIEHKGIVCKQSNQTYNTRGIKQKQIKLLRLI